jgi:aspartate/glutamate racemase
MTRVTFLHTGAVVIPAFQELAQEYLPGVEIHNLLDDRVIADLRAGTGDVGERLRDLVSAAKAGGSEKVLLTCSSISGYASSLAEESGIPVLRVDEAMADQAVEKGPKIAVVATLETTLTPTVNLIQERANVAGATVEIRREVVDGAFEAVAAGDRAKHDDLVGRAITDLAEWADVVVLAQASMASAADAVSVGPDVLTSPVLGVQRLAQQLA